MDRVGFDALSEPFEVTIAPILPISIFTLLGWRAPRMRDGQGGLYRRGYETAQTSRRQRSSSAAGW